MITDINKEIIQSKTQILEEYYNAFKAPADFKVGLEYERVSINSETLRNAPYSGGDSLVNLITQFASTKGWEVIKDKGVIIGASNGKSSISLEPGGQLEISLEAKKNVKDIEDAFNRINASLGLIARLNNIDLLPVGLTPYSTWDDISMVPKIRYKIMANYLPMRGKLAHVMMRETAGVQVNYDYSDEYDAILKLKLTNLISPFMSALFANSPIRNNQFSGFKSYRCLAWLYTDKRRCGTFYDRIFDPSCDFSFEDYVDAIFDIPMLFIKRDGLIIDLLGDVTFRQFFEYGFEGYFATMDDWRLHSSLCFPDVRLKHCIEIRNHDSQKPSLALAICALYKGILYNRNAAEEVFNLVKHLKFEDLEAMRMLSAKAGMRYEVKGKKVSSYVKEIFHISRNALVKMGAGDEKYLDKLLPYVLESKCPADILAEEKINDARSLVRYLRNNI